MCTGRSGYRAARACGNQAALIDILTYHVVVEELEAADLVAVSTLTMLNGDDATMTDVEARNGVVHVIDAVLTARE